MEYTALQSAGQMLEHVRRFALELKEASEEMRPRDAERLLQQAAWLERRLLAAVQLNADAPWQTLTDALADAAVEAWRLERVLDKARAAAIQGGALVLCTDGRAAEQRGHRDCRPCRAGVQPRSSGEGA